MGSCRTRQCVEVVAAFQNRDDTAAAQAVCHAANGLCRPGEIILVQLQTCEWIVAMRIESG